MDIAAVVDNQLKEIDSLEKELNQLKETSTQSSLSSLIEENNKFKYQLKFLENTLEKVKHVNENNSVNILNILTALFDYAIKKTYPVVKDVEVSLTPCTNPKFGDYQCNNAMGLKKILNELEIKKTPNEIAHELLKHLLDCDAIEKIDVAPSGFINIFIKRQLVSNEITKIIRQGVQPPKLSIQRVIVDYSSPNVAKEMHVGHLRSTIIGDCLARLYRYLGMDVLAINHIGDWGTQFGMLIAHLHDKFPQFETECPPIKDLQAFYKESKKRFDEDEEFKKRAYLSVVALQSHETKYINAWRLICDASRLEFEKIYQRLGVEQLVERGESFYQDKMENMVKKLDDRGLLTFDEGRKLLRSEYSDVHMLMKKSDGGFTYDTSDMAALENRLVVEKADTVLYVVDSGQGGHFDGLFGCGRTVGLYDPCRHRLEHVGFGVVLGADRKKLKTRAGETVRLVDLLDEGMSRSRDKLLEKGREKELNSEEFEAAQKSVAYGCIKYADLSHNRIKEYAFSFDKMLEDKGNTAVYLLYCYTRISGISRKAQVTKEDLEKYIQTQPKELDFTGHEKEWKLAKQIVRFPEILMDLLKDLTPHVLCEYLYNLCTVFTEFYEACYCVEKDSATGNISRINLWRIVLSEATAAVLRTGFHILGLNPVERM